MGRLMVPRVKNNNPTGTQNTVSLDFVERGSWGPPGNLQIFITYHKTNSRRRNMVEIMLIWRKTLNDQSINQCVAVGSAYLNILIQLQS